MYKLNSGFRWTCTTEIERKVGNFTFELEERDSDIQQLEEQLLKNHDDQNLSNQKLTKSANEKQLEYLLSNLLI
jgi:hypothetical protein